MEFNGTCDEIGFETTMDVMLTGVGLYGGVQASTHDVTLELLKDGVSVSTTKTTMISDGSETPIKVSFEKPVWIPTNTKHVVAATIKGPQTWAGWRGARCDFEASGKIAFYQTENRNKRSSTEIGQIPVLYVLCARKHHASNDP